MRHIEGPSSEHAALSASLEKAVFWQAPWTRTENPQGGERNVGESPTHISAMLPDQETCKGALGRHLG